MSILSILTGYVNIKRLTPFVLDASAVVSSLSATRQPKDTCKMEVSLVNATPAAGTITLTGSTVESFVFTSNQSKVSVRDFTSLSTVAVDGLTSGTVSVRALNNLGQPINQEILVHSSLPTRFFRKTKGFTLKPVGSQDTSEYGLMFAPDKDIRGGDLAYAVSGVIGMTIGTIDTVEALYDFSGASHHLECGLL